MGEARVLPQQYEGVMFRSTLEARWAIFFDHAGIGWEYEPEGFIVAGRPYRPDFLLDCGTWVEVKGDPRRLDVDLMLAAARELPRPQPKYEAGPPLMILGHIPPPREKDGEYGDWGWIGLGPSWVDGPPEFAPEIEAGYYGFGMYSKNYRPWWLEWADLGNRAEYLIGDIRKRLMTPIFDESEINLSGEAYSAARARRFGRQ